MLLPPLCTVLTEAVPPADRDGGEQVDVECEDAPPPTPPLPLLLHRPLPLPWTRLPLLWRAGLLLCASSGAVVVSVVVVGWGGDVVRWD